MVFREERRKVSGTDSDSIAAGPQGATRPCARRPFSFISVLWFLVLLVLLVSGHERLAGLVAMGFLIVRAWHTLVARQRGPKLEDEQAWSLAFRLLGHQARESRLDSLTDELSSILLSYGLSPMLADRRLADWREGRMATTAQARVWAETWRKLALRRKSRARLFAVLSLRQHVLLHGGQALPVELEGYLTSLGIPPLELQAIHTRLLLEEGWRRFAEAYERARQGMPPPPTDTTTPTLREAYATLGVAEEASDEEVTLAYRRLLRRHHPDKLTAAGASEAAIKQATERTQKIRAAYEAIRAARGGAAPGPGPW